MTQSASFVFLLLLLMMPMLMMLITEAKGQQLSAIEERMAKTLGTLKSLFSGESFTMITMMKAIISTMTFLLMLTATATTITTIIVIITHTKSMIIFF